MRPSTLFYQLSKEPGEMRQPWLCCDCFSVKVTAREWSAICKRRRNQETKIDK